MLELLLVWGLAAHRLSFLWLTQELFRKSREGFAWLSPFMAYAVNCSLCMSVWAGAIVYTLWHISWLGQLIVWALAVSLVVQTFNTLNVWLEGKVFHASVYANK